MREGERKTARETGGSKRQGTVVLFYFFYVVISVEVAASRTSGTVAVVYTPTHTHRTADAAAPSRSRRHCSGVGAEEWLAATASWLVDDVDRRLAAVVSATRFSGEGCSGDGNDMPTVALATDETA